MLCVTLMSLARQQPSWHQRTVNVHCQRNHEDLGPLLICEKLEDYQEQSGRSYQDLLGLDAEPGAAHWALDKTTRTSEGLGEQKNGRMDGTEPRPAARLLKQVM